ncbi:hypothetical protein, partial [Lactococcus cremoris]|uniref:hypothetical protein n=1 Tax=Lactococcus lactis subsp. cremoris TaxID=1359 RepID=UPI002FC9B84F
CLICFLMLKMIRQRHLMPLWKTDKDADVSQRLSNVKMREERVKDKEANILKTNLTVVGAIGKHYG